MREHDRGVNTCEVTRPTTRGCRVAVTGSTQGRAPARVRRPFARAVGHGTLGRASCTGGENHAMKMVPRILWAALVAMAGCSDPSPASCPSATAVEVEITGSLLRDSDNLGVLVDASRLHVVDGENSGNERGFWIQGTTMADVRQPDRLDVVVPNRRVRALLQIHGEHVAALPRAPRWRPGPRQPLRGRGSQRGRRDRDPWRGQRIGGRGRAASSAPLGEASSPQIPTPRGGAASRPSPLTTKAIRR